MYRRSRKNWIKHWDFCLLDILCVFVAFFVAYRIRFGSFPSDSQQEKWQPILAFFVLCEVGVSLFFNNLGNVLKRGYYLETVNVTILTLGMLAAVSVVLYATKTGESHSRLLVFYTAGLFFFLDDAARIIWKAVVKNQLKNRKRRKSSSARTCFVVSDQKNVNVVCKALQDDIYENYQIRGIALAGETNSPEKVAGLPCCLLKDAAKIICRSWIDEVFIYLPNQTTTPKEFLNDCMEMGVTVHTILNLEKIAEERQFIESFDDHVMITTAFCSVAAYQAALKRAMDILGGLVGCVLTVLIGIVIGPIIYINSPGPIIFKQTRVGKNGKFFEVYKFRSMVLNAEQLKKDLMAQNTMSDGHMFKIEHDPRIIGNKQLPDGTWKTGIGEFIRKTSLDEFPQFFNVLKGDMSLVGTRPPTVDEWNSYEFHHRARLSVRPGITGLWQVSGRSEITDFEEVVKLDTQYIVKFRLSEDIKILLKTVLVVLTRKGSM